MNQLKRITKNIPQDLIETREALAKAIAVVELCFQNEGDNKLVKNDHMLALLAVAENQVHYTHDLLFAHGWASNMTAHMEGRDAELDLLGLELLEAKAFLQLLAESEGKAHKIDCCCLFGVARKLLFSLMKKVDALFVPVNLKKAA